MLYVDGERDRQLLRTGAVMKLRHWLLLVALWASAATAPSWGQMVQQTVNSIVATTCGASQWARIIAATGAATCSQPAFTDVSGNYTLAQGPTLGANVVLGSVAGGTPAQLTQTQLTALVNLATASLPGSVPAFPNNTTTFLRGDLTYVAPQVTSKVVNQTYNLATASGTFDVTGFGFNPAAIVVTYGVNGVSGIGTGLFSGATQSSFSTGSTTGIVNFFAAQAVFYTDNAIANYQQCTASFITDGVRFTCTKGGSPTGTLQLSILGFK